MRTETPVVTVQILLHARYELPLDAMVSLTVVEVHSRGPPEVA